MPRKISQQEFVSARNFQENYVSKKKWVKQDILKHGVKKTHQQKAQQVQNLLNQIFGASSVSQNCSKQYVSKHLPKNMHQNKRHDHGITISHHIISFQILPHCVIMHSLVF